MPVLAAVTGRNGRVENRDARERAAATMAALAPMTRITDVDIPAGVTATVSRRNLGPVTLVHLTGFAYRQVATEKSTDGVPAGISLGVRPAGTTWQLSQGGVTRGGATNDLVGVVDVTRAMSLRTSADTELFQMYLSSDQLGLGVDELRASAASTERSPLRSLVAQHLLDLGRGEIEGESRDVRQSVGFATVELVRAMLLGTSRPGDLVGTAMSGDHLLGCVKQYVRRHLRNPDLDPSGIARAHAVSVRHLHSLWRDEPTTLSRWIALERLAAVRDALADPALSHRSIAAIAREWCFRNPAHFSRRFHREYGLTPREWRRVAGVPR